MTETAANLVERVLPHVPMRQRVLSVPHGLRYRMAYDADLLSQVMRIFSRAVFQSLRKRASECGIPRGQCGAVTFVQRFGSALNLHPHGHMIVTDGVYAALPGESPRFYPLAPPGQKDVIWVAKTVATPNSVNKVRNAKTEASRASPKPQNDEPRTNAKSAVPHAWMVAWR